ncbi:MAG: Glutathione S-transferase [uncultured Ramlibacter sp.]|uniref:Glutathione S-transferase n=1 Tax=uncultured Ramlibacter sp. TaxID=260755 RepID=A0A6J4PL94_9BURK|nr:MAG: Glutathione S-transferase [uncultured Ramlibacter sp.]
MRLYYDESFNPRKACAVARHLQVPLEYRRVRLARGEHRSPEFLAINPNGRLPALQDGELVLWEANAIMCHLSDQAGADLWPRDAAGQVEVQRWFSWDAAHFSRHGGSLYFEYLIKPALGLGEPDTDAIDEAHRQFTASAAVLDAHLSGRKFLLGDRLSVADFAVSAALPYAEAAKLPLADFPAIRRWHGRLEELSGWRDPYPA